MNDARRPRYLRKGPATVGTARRTATQEAGRTDFSPANAKRSYDRYIELAKEAARSGDRVEMENCYQHAEHYFRMMREPEQR